MLAGTYLTVYGWTGAFSSALDCTTGEPFYAACHSLYGKEQGYLRYFYGRVDDPEIACVEIQLCVGAFEGGETAYYEQTRFSLPRETWIQQSDRQFFLLRTTLKWPEEEPLYAFAVALDAAGRELYRIEITGSAYSYVG